MRIGATFYALTLLVWGAGVPATANSSLEDLNEAFQRQKWDATLQMAYELHRTHPEVTLKGAYALFQKGYNNSALVFLKQLSAKQWRVMPRGENRFAEIVSLFQKKVPLTLLPGRLEQVDENKAPPYLHDEIVFAKGRAAFQKRKLGEAKAYLKAVSPNSRFYAQAHYLLACSAILEKDYERARREFSAIFKPALFEQSTEFWKDIGSQMTSRWGANLNVLMDAALLGKTKMVGELGLLASARLRYAEKEFDLALREYAKLSEQSPFFDRSRLEKVWTFLQLNRHDKAQTQAARLTRAGGGFESVESRIIRAVSLTDSGKTEAARNELDDFVRFHEKTMATLEKYNNYGVAKALPEFIQRDFESDQRLRSLVQYRRNLITEVKNLRETSKRLFPAYHYLAAKLDSLLIGAKDLVSEIQKEHVKKRILDLEDLYLQSRLIRAETYLEDREKLREKFRSMKKITEAQQVEHDKALVVLLERVVNEVQTVLPLLRKRNPFLEFRHAEMLWELGNARLILAQTEDKVKNERAGKGMRRRSLLLGEKVVRDFSQFEKRAQAMFFVGFARLELGKTREASKMLQVYVKTFPFHQHIPDANRILGDQAFDAGQFRNAERYFANILEFEKSPIVGYAHYKIAWCNYHRRRYARTMLNLEKAISWAKRHASRSQLFNLQKEAATDLISIYAEVGTAEKAMDYFDSFVGGEAYQWLQKLARRFDRTGQYEKAIYLYHVLISLKETSEQVPLHYASIIRGQFRLLQWKELITTANEFVEKFRSKLEKPLPEEHPLAQAEKTLREVALAQHFEFKESTDKRSIENIIRLDQIYLSVFDSWPTSQPVQYKLAYFFSKKKRLKEAVAAYAGHWQQFKGSLEEPLREEALRNLVHSLQQRYDKLTKSKSSPEPDIKENVYHQMVRYALAYVKAYPKTEHTRTIHFLHATALLEHGDLQEGIAATQALFDRDRGDKFAKKAFENLRAAYYKQKDWKVTHAWAVALLKENDPKLRPYRGKLEDVRQESLFLWADETSDHVESAKLYLQLYHDPKIGSLREKALYNAIVRYQKTGDRLVVLDLARKLEELNAKSKFLVELTGIRGAYYQEAGDYVRALPLMQAFLKRPPKGIKPEVIAQARLNAALAAQAKGEKKVAVALYQRYLKNAVKGSEGERQALGGIKYLSARADRQPASQSVKWKVLEKRRTRYLKSPVPKSGALAKRVKRGAKTLEETVKAFLSASSDEKNSDFLAYEAFCSVPLLYEAYAKGVVTLAGTVEEDSRVAVMEILNGVAQPMSTKSEELAGECLSKAGAAQHRGPTFEQVIQRWGWKRDESMVAKVDRLLQSLKKRAPWVEPAPLDIDQSAIIQQHLAGKGTVTSWYTLAWKRFQAGQLDAARITFIDTLSRFKNEFQPPPSTSAGVPVEAATQGAVYSNKKAEGEPASQAAIRKGWIYNALAHIEWTSRQPKGVSALFRQATKAGSDYAHVNLAIHHLSEDRLTPGVGELRLALQAGTFNNYPKLQKIAQEVAGP